jgi:hypothetical protein
MSELPAGTAGVTTLLIIGTCGMAGYAVVRADRVAGHWDGTVHAGLPPHGVQNLRPVMLR